VLLYCLCCAFVFFVLCFCIFCAVLLYCFIYVFLFVTSVRNTATASKNSIAVNNNNNNNNNLLFCYTHITQTEIRVQGFSECNRNSSQRFLCFLLSEAMALRKVDFIVVQDDLSTNYQTTSIRCHLKGNPSNGKVADTGHTQSSNSVDLQLTCSLPLASLRLISD
jgi:hypothetical protein